MKLSGWTIVIIFLFAGLSALSYAFWQVWTPYEEAARNNHTFHDALELQANKQPQAVKRVEKAMQIVNEAAAKWNAVVADKTPADNLVGGGVNVFENPYQLVVDSPKYRDNAQRLLNVQLHQGGVKVVAAPEIPRPTDSEKDILASYYNYPPSPFPVVVWELGSVTVTGNYQQISKNVRAWSAMPHYLAVVDGLAITGTTPNLTASYNVTLVGFIKASTVFPAWTPSGALTTGLAPGTPGATGTTPGK